MTDEVAVQVLSDNHAQNATLAVEVGAQPARRPRAAAPLAGAVRAPGAQRRGAARRAALVERRRDGQALTGPELSVLLAYAKLETGDVVLRSGCPTTRRSRTC